MGLRIGSALSAVLHNIFNAFKLPIQKTMKIYKKATFQVFLVC